LTLVRTVCGLGRQAQLLASRFVPHRRSPVAGLATSASATAGSRPLLSDRVGPQRRGGAVLDQVNGTTCGSAVLVALAAWADPAELERLEGGPGDGRALFGAGFGARFDARQKQVHRETNRFWPRALGTTPWGAVRWLHDHVPAAGRHRVRLVDDTSAGDVADVLAAVGTVLGTGRPVPLLVGSLVPRHYVLALGGDGDTWRVYEPTAGQVRVVELEAVRKRRLAPLLGFDRLHAVLLPR
jgi:hypothetical protein